MAATIWQHALIIMQRSLIKILNLNKFIKRFKGFLEALQMMVQSILKLKMALHRIIKAGFV